jgi:hypothetical protein
MSPIASIVSSPTLRNRRCRRQAVEEPISAGGCTASAFTCDMLGGEGECFVTEVGPGYVRSGDLGVGKHVVVPVSPQLADLARSGQSPQAVIASASRSAVGWRAGRSKGDNSTSTPSSQSVEPHRECHGGPMNVDGAGWPEEVYDLLLALEGDPSPEVLQAQRGKHDRLVREPMQRLCDALGGVGRYGRAWPSARSSNPATWRRTGANVWVARRVHMTAQFDLHGLHVERGWT